MILGEVNVMDRTFTASVTPHTSYTFRVAGVNINGTGTFSDSIIILTDEEGIGLGLLDIYDSDESCNFPYSSWYCV